MTGIPSALFIFTVTIVAPLFQKVKCQREIRGYFLTNLPEKKLIFLPAAITRILCYNTLWKMSSEGARDNRPYLQLLRHFYFRMLLQRWIYSIINACS